jgi:predicted PurR-regulated permease PerM
MNAPSDGPRVSIQRHELHVPGVTIVKLLVAAACVWGLLRLAPELLLLAGSILLATALAPVMAIAQRHRIPRWVAVAALGGSLLVVAIVVAVFVLPTIVSQIAALGADLPHIHQQVLERLHPSPIVTKAIDKAFDLPSSAEVRGVFKEPIAIGMTALSGMTTVVLTVVLTLYLLQDGKRLYAWLLAYVPRRHRTKMAATVPELSKVICSFIRGQLTISLLFSLYVVVIGLALRLPAVLPLALLAFACDIIPVVGIFIATLPAAALALADSPVKAAIVAGAFFAYHMVETYIIAPRVYGSSMRLSTLGVVMGLLFGCALFGIFGGIFSLPLIAAYPIIERIWLKDYLAPDVLREHAALDRADEAGPGSDEAIEAVLNRQERGESTTGPHSSRSSDVSQGLVNRRGDRHGLRTANEKGTDT